MKKRGRRAVAARLLPFRSVVVQENSFAELICHAYGAPPPSVSWRRENNAILPTGGIQYRGNILKIHSVKKEDRGTYYCVADNGIGKSARRNVAVEVEFPPDIQGGGQVSPRAGTSKKKHVETLFFVCVGRSPRPRAIRWSSCVTWRLTRVRPSPGSTRGSSSLATR